MTPVQTHSLNVEIAKSRSESFPETDALITFTPHLPIGVRTADCVPILLYAPDIKAAAAIHAGWKGTLGGIIDNTIDILEKNGGSPESMIVVFGPSISVEKYEVSQDLADMFIDKGFQTYVNYPNGRENKPHLDLQGINKERCLRRGIKEENIQLSNFCTFSSINRFGEPLFQSYRREGEKAGRNLSVITLI